MILLIQWFVKTIVKGKRNWRLRWPALRRQMLWREGSKFPQCKEQWGDCEISWSLKGRNLPFTKSPNSNSSLVHYLPPTFQTEVFACSSLDILGTSPDPDLENSSFSNELIFVKSYILQCQSGTKLFPATTFLLVDGYTYVCICNGRRCTGNLLFIGNLTGWLPVIHYWREKWV